MDEQETNQKKMEHQKIKPKKSKFMAMETGYIGSKIMYTKTIFAYFSRIYPRTNDQKAIQLDPMAKLEQ